jgi:integrase
MFSKYIHWLHKKGTLSPRSIKTWVSTARSFLETFDIDISPRKFQLKVRMPRVGRTEKVALSKEDIQTILNSCHSLKLKTYLLFLGATGTRATETLSIRLCDINFDREPATVQLRSQYTKTRTARTILLTHELTDHLKSWLKFKYRTRSVGYYNRETRTTLNKVITPTVKDKVLIFSTNGATNKDPALDNLYSSFLKTFEHTLERLGGKYAEFEDDDNKRRKITFHSFRRFVKTTISDLGYSDYSEYFLGHQGSTYYRKTEKEKIELFRKVEPYLTFLDITSLERQGADVQTRLETVERENQRLRQYEQRMKKIENMLDNVADQLGL